MAAVYRADRVALNFYDFCDFSSDPQKYVHPNKNHHKHFSRKNLLQKKYSLTYKAPSTVCPINLKAELYFSGSAPSVHTNTDARIRINSSSKTVSRVEEFKTVWTENLLKTERLRNRRRSATSWLSCDFIARVFHDHKSNMADDEIIGFLLSMISSLIACLELNCDIQQQFHLVIRPWKAFALVFYFRSVLLTAWHPR